MSVGVILAIVRPIVHCFMMWHGFVSRHMKRSEKLLHFSVNKTSIKQSHIPRDMKSVGSDGGQRGPSSENLPVPSLILTLPSLFFPLLVLVTPSNVGKESEEKLPGKPSLPLHTSSEATSVCDDAGTAGSPICWHQLLCAVFCSQNYLFLQIIRLLVLLLPSLYMTHCTESKIIFSYRPFKAPTHATTILFSHCLLIKSQLQLRIFHCSDTGCTRAIYTTAKHFCL